MVTVVVFKFSVMRCQPLNWALAQSRQNGNLETNGHRMPDYSLSDERKMSQLEKDDTPLSRDHIDE